MPVLGDNSVFAAVTVECAAEQGAFWPFHDRFMADDATLFTEPGLRRQAAFEGLDVDAFWSCVSDGDTLSLVIASYDEGAARGVRGTPTVFIDGALVEPTYEAVAEAIERAAGQ